MFFSIITFYNCITLFVHHHCKLKLIVYLNVVSQLSFSLIKLLNLSIITVNASQLFICMLFFNSHLYNCITLFVHHHCKLKLIVYLNVVSQLSFSLIKLLNLSIITVNASQLFICMLFFNSHLYNCITLFVHHYCKRKLIVYLNVVCQLSFSLTKLLNLSIITVNASQLFICMLFLNSHFL